LLTFLTRPRLLRLLPLLLVPQPLQGLVPPGWFFTVVAAAPGFCVLLLLLLLLLLLAGAPGAVLVLMAQVV
jgi:hypothetical protein